MSCLAQEVLPRRQNLESRSDNRRRADYRPGDLLSSLALAFDLFKGVGWTDSQADVAFMHP